MTKVSTKYCPGCRRLRPLRRGVWAFDGRGAPADRCRACGGVARSVVVVREPLRVEAILELAATGLTDKAIARRLGLAFSTVRNHLERHYQRSGQPCRTAAVVAWLLDECSDEQREAIRRRLLATTGAAAGVVA